MHMVSVNCFRLCVYGHRLQTEGDSHCSIEEKKKKKKKTTMMMMMMMMMASTRIEFSQALGIQTSVLLYQTMSFHSVVFPVLTSCMNVWTEHLEDELGGENDLELVLGFTDTQAGY